MHFFKTLLTAALTASVLATPISDVSSSESNTLQKRTNYLTRTKLKKAWEDASEFAALRSETFTEIVQGGAVNVYIGSRSQTSDMDFIDTQYTSTSAYEEILNKLKRAWKYAYEESVKRSQPIESKWADNTIQFFFHNRPELWSKYKSRAISQNYVLSTAGMDDDGTGIKFIAAAWDWQFVGKLVDPKKSYDWQDAAAYLQKYLGSQSSIPYQTIKTWFPAWGQNTPSHLREYCAEVNKAAGKELITGLKDKSPSPCGEAAPQFIYGTYVSDFTAHSCNRTNATAF